MADSMKFAGSVMLGDLNDFIAPTQACVNPLFTDTASESKEALGMAKISLESGIFSGLDTEVERPSLIRKSKTKTAKVSLSDCLACSGCVTSAETVLITQQSTAKLLEALTAQEHRVSVISLSPQSLASLAHHFCITDELVFSRLQSFFRGSLGVDVVIDTGVGLDLALLEARAEFVRRYQTRAESAEGKRVWQKPPVSVAVSSELSVVVPGGTVTDAAEQVALVDKDPSLAAPLKGNDYSALPMLASECPGWICFAEKTFPQCIPYISTVKSPQQITGTLVKSVLIGDSGLKASEVFHATVMPCFDKKLEASRKDFYNKVDSSTDVDCVISTAELLDLLSEKGVDLAAEAEGAGEVGAGAGAGEAKTEADEAAEAVIAKLNTSLDAMIYAGGLHRPTASNAGSNGYLEHIFRHAAKELFGVTVEGPLKYKQGRNADIRSVELKVDGEVVLTFASAYGFRNIQSVVRQMQRNKCKYDYVEIMACPSGCVNGGGQVQLRDTDEEATRTLLSRKKEVVVEVAKALHATRRIVEPGSNPTCAAIISAHGEPMSEHSIRQLHTHYHNVPNVGESLTIKW